MTKVLRVVHYLNQFFGQIGGEDKADTPMLIREGPVGPGLAVKAALKGRGEVVGTVICGDNHMAERLEDRAAEAADAAARFKPDLLLAGPAFGAGRYGMACGAVCAAVAERLGVPAVMACHEDNPAAALYRRRIHIAPAGPTAASMRVAAPALTELGIALAEGCRPAPGTFLPKGLREAVVMRETGAERACRMLADRLHGREFVTELPPVRFAAAVCSPPLADLTGATIFLVTEGGLAPTGNPDRIEASMATKFGAYSVEGLDGFRPDMFHASHGGYDNAAVNADPNRLLPLDAMRELERLGEVGAVAPVFYATAGNATTVENARRFGQAIGEDIRKRIRENAGVFLTAT